MNTVVLLKGNLISDGNDTKIGSDIEFIDSYGKSVKTKSNSLDGLFVVVLKPGENYKIFVKGYKLLSSNMINVQKLVKILFTRKEKPNTNLTQDNNSNNKFNLTFSIKRIIN